MAEIKLFKLISNTCGTLVEIMERSATSGTPYKYKIKCLFCFIEKMILHYLHFFIR